jgi:hypothetical protein
MVGHASRGRRGARVLSAGVCAVAAVCVTALAVADDAIPAALPAGRYEHIRTHSPFAVATAEAPPVQKGASFAANWFVSGIARIGGDDFVTIKSRDLATQFSLFGKGDKVNDVALASVTWSDAVGKSTVILRKGTETAKLEFNEAEVQATQPAAGTAAGAKPASGIPGVTAGPTVAGQHNVRMPPTPVAGIPGHSPARGAPAGNDVRRRAQVILPPQ